MVRVLKFKRNGGFTKRTKRSGLAAFGVTAMLIMASCGGDNGTGTANNGDDDSSLKDIRDGKTYKIVKIDNQVWMAENLNFATSDSYYYDNDSVTNADKYGRLYTWAATVTACPDGWHLPSDEEWQTLVDFAGGSSVAGEKLKSQSGWSDFNDASGNGTDKYGFSALPGGRFISTSSGVENFGYWWSATERDAGVARGWTMLYNHSSVSTDWNSKIYGFSVRCLKD